MDKSHHWTLGRDVCSQTQRTGRKWTQGQRTKPIPKLHKIRPAPSPTPKQIQGTKRESLWIKKNVSQKGKEKPDKFLILSQIFKCKLHVITRRPDLGKTDSINCLASNPCYCTKATLAPWSQFNFESLLSENNGMSPNLCQQFQRILMQPVWVL